MKISRTLLSLALFAAAALPALAEARDRRHGAPVRSEDDRRQGLFPRERRKGRPPVVLMFVATKCPVSNAYNDRMPRSGRSTP